MDEALKRAFTDAYLRYEIAFAQFTTSNSARAHLDRFVTAGVPKLTLRRTIEPVKDRGPVRIKGI